MVGVGTMLMAMRGACSLGSKRLRQTASQNKIGNFPEPDERTNRVRLFRRLAVNARSIAKTLGLIN